MGWSSATDYVQPLKKVTANRFWVFELACVMTAQQGTYVMYVHTYVHAYTRTYVRMLSMFFWCCSVCLFTVLTASINCTKQCHDCWCGYNSTPMQTPAQTCGLVLGKRPTLCSIGSGGGLCHALVIFMQCYFLFQEWYGRRREFWQHTPAMAIASLKTAFFLIIPLTNYLWSFIYEFHKLKQHSETISKNF